VKAPMSRKQLIEEQFKEARRQYEAGELPLDEDNATANWPLHKYAVYLYNDEDGSPELLEVFLEHAVAGVLRYEDLADNAVELERRHFPHVAEILWKVAENATLHRLGVVLWHAIALTIHDAEVALSYGKALFGGFAKPLHRLIVVLWDAGCERSVDRSIRCDARARIRPVRDHAWAGHNRAGAC
jgi:hypothetical protein